MNAMKRLYIGVAIVLAMLMCACAKTPEAATPLIIVITKGSTGEFWLTFRAGASAAARENKVYLEWPSTFWENELAGQASVVKEAAALARRQNRRFALVVDPVYGGEFAELIHDWQIDYGLAVVNFDDDILRDRIAAGSRFVTFVGTDNEKAGREAAEFLAQKLNGKGNVAMLRLNPGIGTTTLREKGFLDVIEKNYPDIVVRDQSYYWAMNVDVDSAYREGLTLLDDVDKSKVPLDGVFASNESTTMGMLLALTNHGLVEQVVDGRIKFIGFDRNALLENALQKKQITALVVQDPFQMGRQSVEKVVALLGKTIPETIEDAKQRKNIEPTYTRYVLADHDELDICRSQTHRRDNYEFTTLIKDLEARSSIFKRFFKQRNAAQDPAQGACDTEVLRLLVPNPKIWHLQSPGSWDGIFGT